MVIVGVIGIVVYFSLPQKYQNEESTSNKTQIKVRFVGESDLNEYCFNNNFVGNKESIKLLYISKNHPRIKQLASENKLQKDKKFIIRYGKVDKEVNDTMLTFDKFNAELEIKET